MRILPALLLSGASAAAVAQTPTANLMPDGSKDMYAGLGVASTPRYQGARDERRMVLPVLQIQWSNGVFVSGPTLGMQWSDAPGREFGPLLALMSGRSASGQSPLLGGFVGGGVGGVNAGNNSNVPTHDPATVNGTGGTQGGVNRLRGMDEIGLRAQLGGFFNDYLTPALRLTNSVLYGSGQRHGGLLWNADLQQVAAPLGAHHSLSLSAGLTLANRRYLQSYFGVSAAEAARSGNPAYGPSAGLRDVHAGLRWNWALAPACLLTSGVQYTRLAGAAADSPLVERAGGLTISSALAYRF